MNEKEMMRRRSARKARMRRQRNRRAALVVCLLLAVCVISIGGTVAWLQDKTGEIVNEFTPSNVDATLEESKDLDLKMVPGSTITKDPVAGVTDTDVDVYLFVKIEESTAPDFDEYMTYEVADGWTRLIPAAVEAGADVDEWVYYRVVKTTDTTKAFSVLKGDQVKVKSSVTEADMVAISGDNDKPTLTFTAYAIQKDNIEAKDGKTAVEVAWGLVSAS